MDKKPANFAVRGRHLIKKFNSFTAVDGIDFEVKPAECLGFLGPNGAGKTTTMRMIYGMSPPTSGELTVLNMDVRTQTRNIKRRLGVVPQETNLDISLSVEENLLVYANYFGISGEKAREKARQLLIFLNLDAKAKTSVDSLSGGMKKRLLMARSLLNEPELLLLDEPTTGLDPQARHLIWDKLRDLKEKGITQILTTHYMDEASRLCDRVVIMDTGRIIAEGAPQALIDNYVSQQVIEVRVTDRQRERLLERLKPELESFDTHNDLVLLYTNRAQELFDSLTQEDLDIKQLTQRSANLEDVFLKLTGRRLRE